MISDYRYHRLNIVRDYMSLAVYPIQWLVDAPIRVTGIVKQYTHTYHQLVQENDHLRQEQLLQNARTQKFMALEAENSRLRTLLQSSPRHDGETLLVAEIIRVDSDPLIHRVILDKGSQQGVTLGQPVIDAEGVIGEVIEVNRLSSRVILLTDTSYGIPVENVRTGVRGIATGTGAIKNLELQHVPNTIDLKPGDTLITSGLDGRYPPGYPVGVISEIFHDPGESFARVQVTPSARLERTRQVLLVQRSEGKHAHEESLEPKTDIVATGEVTKEEKAKESKQESKIGKLNKTAKEEKAQDPKKDKIDPLATEVKTEEPKTDVKPTEEKTVKIEKKAKRRHRVYRPADEFDEQRDGQRYGSGDERGYNRRGEHGGDSRYDRNGDEQGYDRRGRHRGESRYDRSGGRRGESRYDGRGESRDEPRED